MKKIPTNQQNWNPVLYKDRAYLPTKKQQRRKSTEPVKKHKSVKKVSPKWTRETIEVNQIIYSETLTKLLEHIIKFNAESLVHNDVLKSYLHTLASELDYRYSDKTPSKIPSAITDDLSDLGYAFGFSKVVESLFIALIRGYHVHPHIQRMRLYMDMDTQSKYAIVFRDKNLYRSR